MSYPGKDIIAFLQKIRHIAVSCLLSFTLCACSGGIFGTGDGEEIIIPENNNQTANQGDSMPGEGITPHSAAPQIFPYQLITLISDGLNTNYQPDERLAVQPVTHLISTQLNAISRRGINVQVEIAQLEQQLAEAISQCGIPCALAEGSVTLSISQNTIDYEMSLQSVADLSDLPTTGEQSTFTNVAYASHLDGYYDQKLAYSRNDGTEVLVQWTNDRQLVSLMISGSADDTYILTDLRESTTTLRHQNKIDNTIIQAVIKNDLQDNTLIEADWHGAEQHYIRASANETSTTLFSMNPNDSSGSRFREYIALPQLNYTIDSCYMQTGICDNWTPVLTDEIDSGDKFSVTQNSLGDFSATLLDSLPQLTIPANVDEYVISTGNESDNALTQPEPMSLLCGGQRVTNMLRTFCWQPLPLASGTAVFEETLGNGGTSYQRLSSDTF